ncbi:nuclear transport factor 2 family protein [Kaistia dalseonensis]|uniref:SnoaL-like domain-containing protein n=1 Tax=Kaistia dalseonensis TaxID=410840 RepID=A0ABU0H5L2_9HYPH|nr:nuclear transport factor 2 family protein [Kaistia dalseonensis]MCX5495022.1 nuclear transport factor 2 family protein [Kaistia dalseonensis]MDQ0437603.1 hypothetical protein [Kaistia dalseonensis]
MQTMMDRTSLKKAVEGNNAALWTGMYADDAEVRVIDQDHPPSKPLVLKGKKAIGAMYDDICARKMKHHLDESVIEGDHLAFAETCTYDNGTKVYFSAMAELKNGKISRQTNIQAWDR